MPVRLNGSTSGYVELAAPAVAGSTSLELPTDSIKPGMVLVASANIGSGVQSFTVSNCFSSEYDTYKIILTGGAASASSDGSFILGASTTGYYNAFVYNGYSAGTPTGVTVSNGASTGTIWAYNSAGINLDMTIYQPYEAARTSFVYSSSTQGGATNRWSGGGFHDSTASYTSITFQTQGGHTITGGSVRVYGYRNSL